MRDNNKQYIKYLKANAFILCSFAFILAGLTIGYAVLTKSLNINSKIVLRADKDIRITEVSEFNSLLDAYEIYSSAYTEDSVTVNIGLPNLTSQMEYNVTISNKGTESMVIKKIESSVFNNSNMTYSLVGLSEGKVLASNTSVTFTIVFKYDQTLTELPENQTIGAIINFTYEEYTPTKDYITEGNILDLRGDEMPSSGAWVDTRNNKSLTLNSVIYDAALKAYDFSTTNAYATLGAPIIPETGDFTLEAYIKTPASFKVDDDQAIVAQINDTYNDAGRFKLNWKYNSPAMKLVVFFNSQTPSTNQTLFFTDASTAVDTNYLLQVVRKGNTLSLYLNGVFISENQYDASNKISQEPFKLARWNSAATQQFFGEIYSVRVYNRALSSAELTNNMEMDLDRYKYETKPVVLKDYVISQQLITSGNGLYQTSTNEYKYKGLAINNYLKFQDDNDIYRIVSYNDDGTIKIVNSSVEVNTPFDASGNRIYDAITSSYCDRASTIVSGSDYYGCNFFGTTTDYNGKNVPKDSTIKVALEEWYSTLNSNIKGYIVPHVFNVGLVDDTATYDEIYSQAQSLTYNGDVGLLEITDIVGASINQISSMQNNITINNYLGSISNSSTGFWTLNSSSSNSYDVWAVAYGTQLGKKRASRTFQYNNGVNAYFLLKPAFYIYDDVTVSGTGAYIDPFIIIGRNS